MLLLMRAHVAWPNRAPTPYCCWFEDLKDVDIWAPLQQMLSHLYSGHVKSVADAFVQRPATPFGDTVWHSCVTGNRFCCFFDMAPRGSRLKGFLTSKDIFPGPVVIIVQAGARVRPARLVTRYGTVA